LGLIPGKFSPFSLKNIIIHIIIIIININYYYLLLYPIEEVMEEQLYNLFRAKPNYLMEDTYMNSKREYSIITKTNNISNHITSSSSSYNNIDNIGEQYHINKKIKLSGKPNVTNIVAGVYNDKIMSNINKMELIDKIDTKTTQSHDNNIIDNIEKHIISLVNSDIMKCDNSGNNNIENVNSSNFITLLSDKKSVSWSNLLIEIIPTKKWSFNNLQGSRESSNIKVKEVNTEKFINSVLNKQVKENIKWSIRNNNVDYHLSDLRSSSEDILEHITQMAAIYSPLISTRVTISKSKEQIIKMKDSFKHYLEELALVYGSGCLEAKAEKEAKDMEIDPLSLTKDSEELKADGSDLLTFIKKRMEVNKLTKLSGMSVKAVLPESDPEFNIAYNIAEDGVLITYDENFIRQSKPIPPRPLQERIPTAILALIVKLYKNNQGLIFRWKDLSPEDRVLLHFSSLHWRGEYAKVLGRLLFDLSNSDIEGCLALNEGTAKQDAIDRWSVVELETIYQWIEQWLKYNKIHKCTWKDCLIGTDDVKGAFPRLNFQPNSAVLVAATISIDENNADNNLIYINTSGAMGWTGTPMAFEAVSRPLARLVQSKITCPLGRYVDDYNLYGKPEHIEVDKRVLQDSIKQYFGQDGIADEKDKLDSIGDLLAWNINLLRGEIRPKDKAIAKLTFILFMFDLNVAQPLKLWECIMSLTNYYAKGIRGAISFIKPFQTMVGLAHSGNKTAIATATTKFAIDQWRIMLFTLFIDKESLSIPIEIFYVNNNPLFKIEKSIYDNTSNLIIQGDAGPDQLAVGFYCNKTKELICWTKYKLPYPEWDNVNCHTYYEYLVFMLSQILIYMLYPNNTGIIVTFQWKNDNTAALCWAGEQACKSLANQYACVVVNTIQIESDILMIKPIFISGIDMADIDRASRNMPAPSLTPDKYIHIQDNKIINEIFEITSPYNKTKFMKEHHILHLQIHKLVKQLKYNKL
jgi:hypothetical protein